MNIHVAEPRRPLEAPALRRDLKIEPGNLFVRLATAKAVAALSGARLEAVAAERWPSA